MVAFGTEALISLLDKEEYFCEEIVFRGVLGICDNLQSMSGVLGN